MLKHVYDLSDPPKVTLSCYYTPKSDPKTAWSHPKKFLCVSITKKYILAYINVCNSNGMLWYVCEVLYLLQLQLQYRQNFKNMKKCIIILHSDR